MVVLPDLSDFQRASAVAVLQICLQSVVLGLRVSRGGNCTYGAARCRWAPAQLSHVMS